MFKLGFNTAFIPDDNILVFEKQDLDPQNVSKDERYPSYFYVEIKFIDFCECTNKVLFK